MRRADRRVYGSARWRRVRRVALDRAGWRCEDCGVAARLEVHHVQPLPDGAPYALDNLAALCRRCHDRRHDRRGVDGRRDWRRRRVIFGL